MYLHKNADTICAVAIFHRKLLSPLFFLESASLSEHVYVLCDVLRKLFLAYCLQLEQSLFQIFEITIDEAVRIVMLHSLGWSIIHRDRSCQPRMNNLLLYPAVHGGGILRNAVHSLLPARRRA